MHFTKRLISVILCAIMCIGSLMFGKTVPLEDSQTIIHEYSDSLIIWYSDDSMTDFLNACAVEYHEKSGIRVLPKLITDSAFVEAIYDASIVGANMPDVYILTNDLLEKAYLSGCASIVQDNGTVSAPSFAGGAISACTYGDNLIAYPYYFETSALLYNKTYLREAAVAALDREASGESVSEIGYGEGADADDSSNEAADENTDESTKYTEEEISAKADELIPDTFEDLLAFSDNYTPPSELDSILKWDVKDIFYNYFFVGEYLSVGGENGDIAKQINIYNEDAIRAMKMYQDLNQYFAFEYDEANYDKIISEFIEGKVLYTTATPNVISELEEAIEAGDFQYEYGFAAIPDLNSNLKSRSLSVTDCLVVNGYSDRKSDANKFAQFLCLDKAADLYDKTGKLASNQTVKYDNESIDAFLAEYAGSAPIPKMMSTSNYWLLLETAFADVWTGSQPSLTLKYLSEQIKLQVTGEKVDEKYIDIPSDDEEIEYLDEETLRQEALNEVR